MWAVDREETHSGAKDTLQNLALKDWIWIKRSLAKRLNGAQDMLEAGIHENLLYHAAKVFLSLSSVE